MPLENLNSTSQNHRQTKPLGRVPGQLKKERCTSTWQTAVSVQVRYKPWPHPAPLLWRRHGPAPWVWPKADTQTHPGASGGYRSRLSWIWQESFKVPEGTPKLTFLPWTKAANDDSGQRSCVWSSTHNSWLPLAVNISALETFTLLSSHQWCTVSWGIILKTEGRNDLVNDPCHQREEKTWESSVEDNR